MWPKMPGFCGENFSGYRWCNPLSLWWNMWGSLKNLGNKQQTKRPKGKILQGRFPDIMNFRQKSFMNEILVGIPISWVEVLGFPPKGSRISREKTCQPRLFFLCSSHEGLPEKIIEKKTPRDRGIHGHTLYTLYSLLRCTGVHEVKNRLKDELRISSKGSKSVFSEHWRLVKNGEVAVFFNWKAGETRSEVQQNGEILKCGKSDEIMKSNTNANLFFFCLFLFSELLGI